MPSPQSASTLSLRSSSTTLPNNLVPQAQILTPCLLPNLPPPSIAQELFNGTTQRLDSSNTYPHAMPSPRSAPTLSLRSFLTALPNNLVPQAQTLTQTPPQLAPTLYCTRVANGTALQLGFSSTYPYPYTTRPPPTCPHPLLHRSR